MQNFDVLIAGGTLFGVSPVEYEGKPRHASVAISDGRIAALLPPDTTATAATVIDAAGLFIAPGFVDTHMHDECFELPGDVQTLLLQQGVTTAIAGHCGGGPLFEQAEAARPNPRLNLSYMTGNGALREAAGCLDRYGAPSPFQIEHMQALLADSLRHGSVGLSFGLEPIPGTSPEEIDALAATMAHVSPQGTISVHIRHDDARCIDAVREAIAISRDHGVRVQVSHLTSMTMGRTVACIEEIGRARTEGVDVSFDCYPYDAFCTKAGSPVFDGDFETRWDGRGPECLEAASGSFRGQRLTYETLAAMRAEDPLGLIVAHLMDEDEIMSCLLHSDCVVISDATFIGDGAHPRVSGSFPRALRALRAKSVSWEDALAKMTSKPAERYRIDAGTIRTGGRADLVVFDPATFEDRATFQDPFAPPEGLKAVVVGGRISLQNGRISAEPHGKIFRRTPQ